MNPAEMEGIAAELAERNKGQISARGYAHIGATILQKPNPNVLVFGLGKDADFWRTCAGPEGRVVWLENDLRWVDRARAELGEDAEIHEVDYGPETRASWMDCLEACSLSQDGYAPALRLDLPESVRETRWDVVIVDGPAGFADTNPGRMKPLACAGGQLLYGPRADVFVHDIDRMVERVCSAWFFRAPMWTREGEDVDRLRHYRRRS